MLHFRQVKRGVMMLNSYEHSHAIELLAQTIHRLTRRKAENPSLDLAMDVVRKGRSNPNMLNTLLPAFSIWIEVKLKSSPISACFGVAVKDR